MANPDAAYAEEKANIPGILMLVAGLLGMATSVMGLLAGLFNTVSTFGGYNYFYSEAEEMGAYFGAGMALLMYVFNFIMGIVVAAAGWKMRNLESHGLAMAGAIALMIPCCGQVWCCWPVGLGVGIFALVTLINDEVKEHFH